MMFIEHEFKVHFGRKIEIMDCGFTPSGEWHFQIMHGPAPYPHVIEVKINAYFNTRKKILTLIRKGVPKEERRKVLPLNERESANLSNIVIKALDYIVLK